MEKDSEYKADSIGPEDMSEPSESQDFRGFYETSRVRISRSMPTGRKQS